MPDTNSHPLDVVITRRQLLGAAAALAGAATLAGVAGCSGSSSGSGSSTLIGYGEAGDLATFNPWAETLNETSVANQVFSRLVYKTAKGQPVGDLAETWKLAADGKSLQLNLRAGLQWQDGKKLTADDFVTMYGYLSDPRFKTDAGVQKIKELFAPVTTVKAPDPSTVVMEFSAPVPYILDILDYWYALRFDDPKDTNFLNKPPVGTGPFQLTKFVRGQSASFTSYPKYHINDEPKSDSFRFDVYSAGSNVVSNLQSHQVDGVLVSNPADVKSLKGDSAYYLDSVRLGIWLIEVNVSKAPFNNPAVRQALSYSMNRAQFAQVGNFGLELPVTSPFYTSAATGYLPGLVNAQAFDLVKARSLLDEAGVTSLSITYPTPTTYPNLQTYGEIWQSDLKKIGVTLNIETVDNAHWIDLGSGTVPDIDLVPWQVNRCLQDGAVFFSANSGYRGAEQRFGYKNAQLEQLVKQGASSTDPALRKQIYQRLNKIVVDQAYNISLVTYSNTRAWSANVQGASNDLVGHLMLAGATVTA